MLVLEVSKGNNELKMSLFEAGEFISTVRNYSKRSVSWNELAVLCQESAHLLNKADKKGELDPESFKAFKNIGQLLWDNLLTRQVKDKLSSTNARHLILSIDEELVGIPWEIISNGSEFLGLRFNLGRLINTRRQGNLSIYRSFQEKLRMLIIANPTGDLKSAYTEGSLIKAKFESWNKKVNIDFKSTSVDSIYIKKNLRDYDIVHFAGHCEYDPDNPQNTGWSLIDARFTVRDILKMGEALPMPSLIFSNACQSARESSLSPSFNYHEKVYGLASAFLFSGSRHYLGAACKIRDEFGLIFAREFYTYLLHAHCVGECVRRARLKLLHNSSGSSVLWANYILYGDPSFIFFSLPKKKILPRAKTFIVSKRREVKSILVASGAAILILIFSVYFNAVNPRGYLEIVKTRGHLAQGRNAEAVLSCNQILGKAADFLPAYPLLCQAYQRQGMLSRALSSYFEYIIYSQKKGDKKMLASAYIGAGRIFHDKGDYPKAKEFYDKALVLSTDNKDRLNEAVSLRRLALWYMDKDDDNAAIELLTKSVEINSERSHKADHRYNLACDYFDLGLLFSNKDDFKAARTFYNKSLKLFASLKAKDELSDYYFNQGELYLFEKEYQKALECYARGLKIDLAHNNLPNIASDYSMFGELYLELGSELEAEKYFCQALEITENIEAPLEKASIYYNLAELYKFKGQKVKAKKYLRLSQEIYSKVDTNDYAQVKEDILSLDR
ncbi:MAG: tetratricopeptide repeat protein [Candidatus Omnitrophota bacterium]|nr:CHAT domain-containing protein [Candidatus Omnitrophota bacterium]